jgi:hypothetical protein
MSGVNPDRRNEFGALPCIGCGSCCKQVPCFLAIKAGCSQSPCSFLRWVGNRYRCGIYIDAPSDDIKRYIACELSYGAGCCSSLFNESREKMAARLRRRPEEKT